MNIQLNPQSIYWIYNKTQYTNTVIHNKNQNNITTKQNKTHYNTTVNKIKPTSDVDVSCTSSHGESSKETALDQLVGVFAHDLSVLAGTCVWYCDTVVIVLV